MQKTAAFIGLMVLFLDEAGRGETHPAVVTHVHDEELVNLVVFGRDGNTYGRTSVRAGDKPAQWKPLALGIEGNVLETASFELPPELKGALGDLAASLSSVGSSVSTLSSQVSSLSSQVSSLQSRVEQLEKQLAATNAASSTPATQPSS